MALAPIVIGIQLVSASPVRVGFAIALLLVVLSVDSGLRSGTSERKFVSTVTFRSLYFTLVYGAAIASVGFLGSGSAFEWSNPTPAAWIDLVATILLTTILPGVAIIRVLMDKRHIGLSAKIVMAYFVGMGLTALTVTLLASVGLSILLYGRDALVAVNSVLLVADLFRQILVNPFSGGTQTPVCYDRTTITILCSTFVLVSVLLYGVFFSNLGLRGDLWRHFSDARYIENYGLSSRAVYYPWFFSVYLAGFLSATSFPMIGATLFFVSGLFFLSVLSFYLAASTFVNRRLAAIGASMWASFSGFDWLFFTVSNGSPGNLDAIWKNSLTYLSGVLNQPGFLGFDHPIYLIGASAVLFMVFLVRTKPLPSVFRYTALFLASAIGYMAHVVETSIFLVAILPFLLILSESSFRYSVRVVLSALLGLLAVASIELISGSYILYYTTYGFLWILIALLSTTTPVLVYAVPKLKAFSQMIHLGNPGVKLTTLSAAALFYLYFLSFVVQSATIPFLGQRPFWSFVPIYNYPTKLGTLGVIVVGLFIVSLLTFTKINRPLKELLLLTSLSVICGELLGLAGFIEATRPFNIAFIFVTLAGPIGLQKIDTFSVRNRGLITSSFGRILMAISLLSIIWTSATLSTAISIDLWEKSPGPWQEPSGLSSDEIATLSYIRTNVSPGDFSIAVPGASWASYANQVLGLAGHRTLDQEPIRSIFSSDPRVALNAINVQKVKYIMVDAPRIDIAVSKSYIFSHLLPQLRPVFSTATVHLFELPVTGSSHGVNLSLVLPRLIMNDSLFSVDLAAFSQTPYSYYLPGDFGQFESPAILLANDVGFTGWKDDNFTSGWASYSYDSTEAFGNDGYLMTFRSGTGSPYYDLLSPKLNLTVSRFPYLSIRWRTDDRQQDLGLYLYANGTQTNFHYIWLGRSGNWTVSTIDLRDFPSIGNSQLGGVPSPHDRLHDDEILNRLVFRTPDQSSQFQIDYVKLTSSPIDDSLFSNYVNWIKHGGDMTVVDSSGFGAFAGLMNLTKTDSYSTATLLSSDRDSILTPDLKVQMLSSLPPNIHSSLNFESRDGSVPAMFSMKIGLGKLTFLYAEPLLHGLESSSGPAIREELFGAARYVTGILWPVTPQAGAATKGPLQGYVELPGALISHDADLTGGVRIRTTYVEIETTVALTVTFNSLGQLSSERTYQTRSFHSYGSGIYSFSSESAMVGAISSGPYAGAGFPAGFHLTVEGLNGGLSLSLATSEGNVSIAVPNNEVLLLSTSTPADVLVYSPMINGFGKSVFHNAWYDKIGTNPDPARGGDLFVSAPLNFTYDMGDQQSMRIDDLNINSKPTHLSYFDPLRDQYQYVAIPWLAVLSSTNNYLLLATTSGVLCASVLLQRLRKRGTRAE